MPRTPITREGYERLKEELKRLKSVERPKIIREIAEARAHGDLSENAEYVAAKEKQSLIEGRIAELEAKLAECEVVELAEEPPDQVVFGCVVELKDLDTGQVVRYQIVGEDESDPRNGRISLTSPLGRALIGHRVGDEVEVHTPRGERAYEILRIMSRWETERSSL